MCLFVAVVLFRTRRVIVIEQPAVLVVGVVKALPPQTVASSEHSVWPHTINASPPRTPNASAVRTCGRCGRSQRNAQTRFCRYIFVIHTAHALHINTHTRDIRARSTYTSYNNAMAHSLDVMCMNICSFILRPGMAYDDVDNDNDDMWTEPSHLRHTHNVFVLIRAYNMCECDQPPRFSCWNYRIKYIVRTSIVACTILDKWHVTGRESIAWNICTFISTSRALRW